MTDNLAPLFTDRATRMTALPEAERQQLESLEKSSGDTQFADRQFSALWMSKRTGLPHGEILTHFDKLSAAYFGEGTTPAQAYDRIAATYQVKATKPASGEQAASGEPSSEEPSAFDASGSVISKDFAGSLTRGLSRTGYQTLGGGFSILSAATGIKLARPTDREDFRKLQDEFSGEMIADWRDFAKQDEATMQARAAAGFDPADASMDALLPPGATKQEKRESKRGVIAAEMTRIRGEVKAENDAAMQKLYEANPQRYNFTTRMRKAADVMDELASATPEQFGVRPEFAETAVGQFTESAGSLPATALFAYMGPIAGGAAMTSLTYAGVEDERRGIEGEAYDPRAALFANLASAGPQAAMEYAFGMERIMNNVIKTVPKVGGKIMFGEGIKAMAKASLASGLEEAITEPAQSLWNDLAASLTYDQQRELFTPETFKRMAVESGSAFALGALFGGPVQGLGNIYRNRTVDKAERYLTTRDGGLFQEMDFRALRIAKTDEQLKAMAPDAETGDLLIKAAGGDVQAQADYNKLASERAFVDTDGVNVHGIEIGKVGDQVALRDEFGRVSIVDPNNPEDVEFLNQVKADAAAQIEATEQTLARLKGKFGEALEVERPKAFESLAEMVKSGKLTEAEANDALDAAKTFGGLVHTATLENTRPVGKASAKFDPVKAVWRMSAKVLAGASPEVAVEEVSEAWVHKGIQDQSLSFDDLHALRAEWYKNAGEVDPAAGKGLTPERASIEWFSKRVVEYAVANRNVELPGGWGAWLRTLGKKLREFLAGAVKMRAMLRRGEVSPQLVDFMRQALGANPQEDVRAKRQAQYEKLFSQLPTDAQQRIRDAEQALVDFEKLKAEYRDNEADAARAKLEKQIEDAVKIPEGVQLSKQAQQALDEWESFSLESVKKPLAPAVFLGIQEGIPGKIPDLELYNLTEAIDGHSGGSTVSRQTLEKKGYYVPERSKPSETYSLAQTETPEFRKWFGESKVVDAQGNPLVVYHGTDAAPFTVFDRAKTKSGPSKFGFWFTNQNEFARNFGDRQEAVYLKIENPKRLTLEKWNSIRDKHAKDSAWFEQWRDGMIKQGFDGLIVVGGNEKVGRFDIENPDVFAVFKSEQIKSIGNRGTFDPDNPDITFSLEDRMTPAEARVQAAFETYGIPRNKRQAYAQQMARMAAKNAALFPYPYHQLTALPVQAKVSLAGHEAGFFGRALLPMSERLRFISDKFGNKIGILSRVRKYYFDKGQLLKKYSNMVTPLMRGITRMSSVDLREWSVAASNQDKLNRDRLTAKYGLQNEWAQYEAARDSLRAEMLAAGVDVGLIEEYFPRWCKDVIGLRESIGIEASEGSLEQAIIDEEKKLGRALTTEETNEVIDKAVRGVNLTVVGGGKPSNTKGRSITTIQPNQWDFYADANHALSRWLEQSTESVARYRFFGKNVKLGGPQLPASQFNQEASIGAVIAEELAAGNIKPTQQAEIESMMNALFAPKGITRAWMRGLVDLSYWATMGKLSSALAQVVDLTVSVYKAGLWNTAIVMPKAVLNNFRHLPGVGNFKSVSDWMAKQTEVKGLLSRSELGIDRMLDEFNDQRFTARALNQVFMATGLNFIDGIGKDTLMNAKFRQMSKQAARGTLTKANLKMLQGIFGTDGAQGVIDDLKRGQMTDDVKFAVYNVLADWQPISLLEYPEIYAKGGNLRILYMLKSYSVKMLSAYRREGFMKMRYGDKAQKIEGARNLTALLAMLFMAGFSKDWLVDFILERDPQMDDVAFDNMFKLMQVSRYAVWKSRNRANENNVFGFVGTVANTLSRMKEVVMDTVAPPMVLVERPASDLSRWIKAQESGDAFDYWGAESTQFIPIFGEFVYWGGETAKGKIERRRQLRERREGGGRYRPKTRRYGAGRD